MKLALIVVGMLFVVSIDWAQSGRPPARIEAEFYVTNYARHYRVTTCFLPFCMASAQTELPQARIVNLSVDPEQVAVLHVRPGYVSSVRVLEEVSSVVLGDPGAFKSEHSEDEPQLVFFKATSTKPAQTNALITTRSGHEISLSLVSQGKSDHNEVVDYVLNCERPHSFLITSVHPSFEVGETKNAAPEGLPAATPREKPNSGEQQLLMARRLDNPHWEGKPAQCSWDKAVSASL
jgi:hypothetical protein